MELKDLLKEMFDKKASDLCLKAGSVPHLRFNNDFMPMGKEKLSSKDTENFASSIMDKCMQDDFKVNHEIDFAYQLKDVGRFRVNVFKAKGSVELVFRSIKTDILSFEELNLPAEQLKNLAMEDRGLVLITGTAGSGKSTTLAAVIDYINQNAKKHIIAIEDPIEFEHTDKKSIVSQREVGSDTNNFAASLKRIVRQTPDVILIGEMRDHETIESAFMAAETGHLVFSTLHTIDAAGTLERIINFFPPYQHNQVRMVLSLILKAVISMRLLRRSDGTGLVPACEIMLSTPTIKKMILEGRTNEIPQAIETDQNFGMQSFTQSLLKLYQNGKVTLEEARRNATNPGELDLLVKGIKPNI